jgi:hypothetical protein
MLHVTFQKRYWCSCLLINRLQTPTHDMDWPFSHLFDKKLDYSSLRVFGCKFFYR